MIRRARVSLLIPCSPDDIAPISTHLGIEPSEVVESHPTMLQADGSYADVVCHTWALHSPIPADQAGPTASLRGLIEAIRPFGDRLVSLDPRWNRWIDLLYHVTPRHPLGGLLLPADVIKTLASWNLSVSYESFWFASAEEPLEQHPRWWRPFHSDPME